MPPPAARRLLSVVLLAVALSSCDRGSGSAPPEEEPWRAALSPALPTRDAISDRVAAILARPVTPTPTAAPAPTEPPPPAEPFGRACRTLAAPPPALAITNAGAVLFGDGSATWYLAVDGSVRRLHDTTASVLQLDADGERLLLKHGSELVILTGPEFSRIERRTTLPVEGTAAWLDAGHLLLARDHVVFTATERRRVVLDIYLYDLATGTAMPAPWADESPLAAIGTLPPLGIMWGHLVTPWRAEPMPAPILRLQDGIVAGIMTGRPRVADTHPTAARDGALLWVRTWRHGSTTGRAYWKPPGLGEDGAVELTTAPTHRAAVSPDGGWLVVAVQGRDGVELRRASRAEVDAQLDAARTRRAATEARAARYQALEARLAARLAALPIGRSLLQADFGPVLADVPTPADCDLLADALLAELQALGLAEGADWPALEDALAEVAPFVDEHPALVLAVGGLYARALGPDATWLLDTATTGTLTADVSAVTLGDGLSHRVALPFGAAREILAGRRGLLRAAPSLAHAAGTPLFMAENYGEDTRRAVLDDLIARAGVDPLAMGEGPLVEYLARPDAEPAVAMLAIRFGRIAGRPALRLAGAMALATAVPQSADALLDLGDALADSYLYEEAIPILERACIAAPESLDAHLALCDAHIVVGDLAAATALLDRARELDPGGTEAELIASRVDLLIELQKAKGAAP
jgi:tetratricopeptide (TPR) repeat protein